MNSLTVSITSVLTAATMLAAPLLAHAQTKEPSGDIDKLVVTCEKSDVGDDSGILAADMTYIVRDTGELVEAEVVLSDDGRGNALATADFYNERGVLLASIKSDGDTAQFYMTDAGRRVSPAMAQSFVGFMSQPETQNALLACGGVKACRRWVKRLLHGVCNALVALCCGLTGAGCGACLVGGAACHEIVDGACE